MEEELVVQRRTSRETRTKSAAKTSDAETLPSRDDSATVIVRLYVSVPTIFNDCWMSHMLTTIPSGQTTSIHNLI